MQNAHSYSLKMSIWLVKPNTVNSYVTNAKAQLFKCCQTQSVIIQPEEAYNLLPYL